MNSLNTHDANDMQSHKLGDAMFDEDDIFCPPSFDEQIYYDDSMPPIYDDYCDDTYVIKSSDNYCHNFEYPFTEHYSLNVGTIFSIQVSYDTPTIVNENKIAYMESNKFSIMKRKLYVMVILMNLFMMLLKIIMREELMTRGALFMFQFLSFMRASLNSLCLAKRH